MAADYTADKIRNIVLLGHSHDGKTTLAEAMLFATGRVARMGSPDQGTAATDFEPDGKGGEAPIPEDMKARADEYRGQLIEAAAESDDSLLEKYLDTGTLDEADIQRGLREGILAGKVTPVLYCSSTKLLGVRTLMSAICELLPPAEGDASSAAKALVLSTGGDQSGRASYSKVVPGTVQADAQP